MVIYKIFLLIFIQTCFGIWICDENNCVTNKTLYEDPIIGNIKLLSGDYLNISLNIQDELFTFILNLKYPESVSCHDKKSIKYCIYLRNETIRENNFIKNCFNMYKTTRVFGPLGSVKYYEVKNFDCFEIPGKINIESKKLPDCITDAISKRTTFSFCFQNESDIFQKNITNNINWDCFENKCTLNDQNYKGNLEFNNNNFIVVNLQDKQFGLVMENNTVQCKFEFNKKFCLHISKVIIDSQFIRGCLNFFEIHKQPVISAFVQLQEVLPLNCFEIPKKIFLDIHSKPLPSCVKKWLFTHNEFNCSLNQ